MVLVEAETEAGGEDVEVAEEEDKVEVEVTGNNMLP